jgi:hypothetical protein
MTSELRKQLRDADPIRSEPALATTEIHAMRRKILANAAVWSHSRPQLLLPVAIALGLMCAMVTTIFFMHRFRPADVPIASPQTGDQRQLQFTTPGGTRIIWVLNPNLQL